MTVRPIVTFGDPRLRLPAEPVDAFGRYLHELLDDMIETMRAAPGVGLAAPQVGITLQACVIEVDGQVYELMNPRIVRMSGDQRDLEGCLSLPFPGAPRGQRAWAGYYANVTRRDKVWAVAQNRHGRTVKVVGTGLLARALQHEVDHLNGRLFVDYLDSMDELVVVPRRDDDEDEDELDQEELAQPA